MKRLLTATCLLFVQKCDAFDRWLCCNLHWSLRHWWHELWVRQDKFHPSLDSSYIVLSKKIHFRKKLIRVWIDVASLRPISVKERLVIESSKILDLEDRLYAEYTSNLVTRREIAHQRDNALQLP